MPDARDFTYTIPRARRLPPAVDLSPSFGPVYDQGDLGSCTANAGEGARQFDAAKQGLDSTLGSRLFLYFNSRTNKAAETVASTTARKSLPARMRGSDSKNWEKLPPGFQRSEFLLEHGMLDMVVDRRELKKTLVRVVSFLKN